MLLLASSIFLSSPVQQAARTVVDATVAQYLTSHAGEQVSLVVQSKADLGGLVGQVRDSGGSVDQAFPGLPGFAATVSAGEADSLNHDARVARLSVNAKIRWLGSAVDSSNLVNRYNALSRVPKAWNSGADGSGIEVAVIDSGVWPHDDLTKASPYVPANTGNRLLDVYTNPHATDAYDHVGHGTHVAGIVGGNGYDSSGQYIGIAPNSLIVGVKIADDLGNANEGDVITGMEWVLGANAHGMHIRIVTMSLASTVAQSFNTSALDAEVERLWAHGIVVVAAAGNGTGAVDFAPGNDPKAITVGSIDDNYQSTLAGSQMASWALYGATQDGYAKPEIVADGSHVVSLLAPGSSLSLQHQANIVGTSYFKMGGTSMAAPQVAGLAALILQSRPNLSNGQVKRLLRRTAAPFSTTAYTSWLGTTGGFADASAVGQTETADDNAGTSYSQSYDPTNDLFLANGSWFSGANFLNANWAQTAWDQTAWVQTSWSSSSSGGGLIGGLLGVVGAVTAPLLNSVVWTQTSWSQTSWTQTSWTQTGWTQTSWSQTSWSQTSWSQTSWSTAQAWDSSHWL